MTTSRVQLALNVTDIDAATRFYRDLFGVEPAKQRPGYANFEIPDPPLKLVLSTTRRRHRRSTTSASKSPPRPM
jgi:catechol 2,3-dioxygenase-like lactoylglutathione lyase family enzyme